MYDSARAFTTARTPIERDPHIRGSFYSHVPSVRRVGRILSGYDYRVFAFHHGVISHQKLIDSLAAEALIDQAMGALATLQ